MNRRSLLAGFAATASGLLMPETRRVYSFLWAPETASERTIVVARRHSWQSIQIKFEPGQVLVLPEYWEVKAIA